jgi:hypothetical protein
VAAAQSALGPQIHLFTLRSGLHVGQPCCFLLFSTKLSQPGLWTLPIWSVNQPPPLSTSLRDVFLPFSESDLSRQRPLDLNQCNSTSYIISIPKYISWEQNHNQRDANRKAIYLFPFRKPGLPKSNLQWEITVVWCEFFDRNGSTMRWFSGFQPRAVLICGVRKCSSLRRKNIDQNQEKKETR